MSNQNKYGLILREKSKSQLTFQASHNVFGNDSDSDDNTRRRPVLLQPSDNINRQSKLSQEKAIIEDPTVYQYDEIYDSITKEKESKKEKKKDEKTPKYIENLIKFANKRKLENERRIERQVQKEREKEGDEFADKEVFVTSAYKKKLEEMHLEEEKEKHEDYLESIADVTKQNDLGGFYRHLYEQKLGSDKTQQSSKNVTPEIEDKSQTIEVKTEEGVSNKLKQNIQRNYRKHKFSSEKKLSEGEIEDSEDEINFSNLDDIRTFKKSKLLKENIDADSDFSIDESSEEEENKIKEVTSNENTKSEKSDKTVTKESITTMTQEVSTVKPKEVEESKIKIDIWKKRTIGKVFEQALKRYYERKSVRST